MANPLDSFKKLPTWGKVAVAAGGAGVAFLVLRAHASAAAAPAAAAATDIDPETGDPSGSPADEAALEQLQGGFPVDATSGGVTTPVGTTSGFGTNDAWSQAAQAGLSDIGFDPETIATALGAWLDGDTLTAGQAAIVNAARAEFGNPPVSPPPVVLGSSTGPAVSGNDSTPSVSGGHVISKDNNEAVVGWTGRNATSYRVTIHGPGPLNGRENTITGETASYSGLEAGHTYAVTVVPVGAGGTTGKSGTINVVTTKGK